MACLLELFGAVSVVLGGGDHPGDKGCRLVPEIDALIGVDPKNADLDGLLRHWLCRNISGPKLQFGNSQDGIRGGIGGIRGLARRGRAIPLPCKGRAHGVFGAEHSFSIHLWRVSIVTRDGYEFYGIWFDNAMEYMIWQALKNVNALCSLLALEWDITQDRGGECCVE